MPPPSPSDDFSQLPTADGLSADPGSSSAPSPPRKTVIRKPQTRIGPQGLVSPVAEQPAPPVTSESDAAEAAAPESYSPPRRKTVIGTRASSSADSPLSTPQSETRPKSNRAPQAAASSASILPTAASAVEDGQDRDLSASLSQPHPPQAQSVPLWRQKWEKWGGKALGFSILVHGLLLVIGGTAVFTQISEPSVDFLPGGSQQGAAASESLEHKIQQKKSPWLKKSLPARKLVANTSSSEMVLPEEVPDLFNLPKSTDLFSDNRLTSSMALGGAGRGFGQGVGVGQGSGVGRQGGMVFQPISMFGMDIKARKLAVVLDVSTSMMPHLPRVIEELDRVSKGSPVILFFGCGLEPAPPGGIDGGELYPTAGQAFEKYWRQGGASLADCRSYTIDRKRPIPFESIYNLLSKRPQTFFIHLTGVGYTWQALLSDRISTSDAIYWFSDFEDRVDFRQLDVVREALLKRKQKLYMHAYMRGSSFDLVSTQLARPTGGDVKLEE